MMRVVMMEQVSLGEWNEKSRKENGQDAVDGMKQEDLSLAYDRTKYMMIYLVSGEAEEARGPGPLHRSSSPFLGL